MKYVVSDAICTVQNVRIGILHVRLACHKLKNEITDRYFSLHREETHFYVSRLQFFFLLILR